MSPPRAAWSSHDPAHSDILKNDREMAFSKGVFETILPHSPAPTPDIMMRLLHFKNSFKKKTIWGGGEDTRVDVAPPVSDADMCGPWISERYLQPSSNVLPWLIPAADLGFFLLNIEIVTMNSSTSVLRLYSDWGHSLLLCYHSTLCLLV